MEIVFTFRIIIFEKQNKGGNGEWLSQAQNINAKKWI